jgi:hypothetical protein
MISLRPIPGRTTPDRRFHDVSIVKLIVLWCCTFGLYHFYWHYKQWSYEEANGSNVTPWARAIFAPFFAFSLFGRINDACEHADTSSNWNPVVLGILYFIGVSSFKLGGHTYWAVGYLTFLPIIPIQLSINELNRRVAPDVPANTRFSFLQVVLVTLGGFVFANVIVQVLLNSGPR